MLSLRSQIRSTGVEKVAFCVRFWFKSRIFRPIETVQEAGRNDSQGLAYRK